MTIDVFDRIAARLADRVPLTDADVETLVSSYDLVAIGMLADDARRRRHGDQATFVRVADVPLNDAADPGWPAGAGEIRLTGAPQDADAALDRVRQVIAAAGTIPVSAFSLADLEQRARARAAKLPVLLRSIRNAGLELLAEAPIDLLEQPEAALAAAADAGLLVARVTVQASTDAVALFRRLAAIGPVRAFAPLPRRLSSIRPSTGYEDVKQVALARLLVDNTDSVQVDWALYGPKLAQVTLTFGADDVDAVSAEEDGTLGRRRGPLEEIRRNIRAAALTPVERNGRFERLDR